jgi:hypothetical protein
MNIRDNYDIDTAAVRALAFELWRQRGCPEGSPDIDWQRAEELLRESGTSDELIAA